MIINQSKHTLLLYRGNINWLSHEMAEFLMVKAGWAIENGNSWRNFRGANKPNFDILMALTTADMETQFYTEVFEKLQTMFEKT